VKHIVVDSVIDQCMAANTEGTRSRKGTTLWTTA